MGHHYDAGHENWLLRQIGHFLIGQARYPQLAGRDQQVFQTPTTSALAAWRVDKTHLD